MYQSFKLLPLQCSLWLNNCFVLSHRNCIGQRNARQHNNKIVFTGDLITLTLSQWSSSGLPVAIQCAWNLGPSVHWNATGDRQCGSSGIPVYTGSTSGIPVYTGPARVLDPADGHMVVFFSHWCAAIQVWFTQHYGIYLTRALRLTFQSNGKLLNHFQCHLILYDAECTSKGFDCVSVLNKSISPVNSKSAFLMQWSFPCSYAAITQNRGSLLANSGSILVNLFSSFHICLRSNINDSLGILYNPSYAARDRCN